MAAIRSSGRRSSERRPATRRADAQASMTAYGRRPLRMGPRALLHGTSALTAAAVMASAGWALATPSGGTVVAGKATITQTGPKTIVINQQSNKVIIEWKNFDIGKGEKVVFTQPGAVAAALNRVLSGSKTSILGSLTANGTIIITNPKGIVFGASARVDVASIIASTIGISNSNFLAGRMIFDQPGDPGAMVSNAGEITVKSGGLAALVAPGVENTGVITAKLGTVALAAGNAATLDFYGDGLVQIAVTAPVKEVPIGPDGKPVTALVHQAGQIFADGGTVVLTAAAAEGVIDRIINVEGIVRARTIENHQGQIAFVGDGPGEVQVAGVVDASGKDEGQVGGTVHVLGKKVTLASTASIDVSGDKGGGTVLVGGELQGKALVRTSGLGYEAPAPASQAGTTVVLSKDIATSGYIPESEITYVDAGAVVMADAVTNGDGGKAVTWSNGSTDFGGYVSARGGASSGNGGFVEVSGLGGLAYRGTVDTRAPHGSDGWLLLDPNGVEVRPGTAATPPGSDASAVLYLTDGKLNDMLTTSNVLLYTTGTGAGYTTSGGGFGIFGSAINSDNIIIQQDTAVDTGTHTLFLSSATVDLYADITGTVAGGASATGVINPGVTLRDPTTVNVYDSRELATPGTTVASIQDALDIVATGGTVNVGAGTFAGGVTVAKNDVTLQGTGFTATTVVEVDTASSGFTVTADNVTIDGYLFTPKAGATDTTGITVTATADGTVIGTDDAAGRDGNGFEWNGTDKLTRGIRVLAGAGSTTIRENVMGSLANIDTDGIVEEGTFDSSMTIADNEIHADDYGVLFKLTTSSDSVVEGSVTINDGNAIAGGLEGVNFEGVVRDGPEGGTSIDISDNASIVGSAGDGIHFHGVIDLGGNAYSTTVLIGGNTTIQGHENGIHFDQPPLPPISTFAVGTVLDQGWSIDGAQVTIDGNTLIQGDTKNGILVEGVRGTGSFEPDFYNLKIIENGGLDAGIKGYKNGIAITRVWESFSPDCDTCTVGDLTLTAAPVLDGGVGASGWAVENAKVKIADNTLIQGEHDNGILIEGIHSQKPVEGPVVGPVVAGLITEPDPETVVKILGNDQILGNDNGIAITRGIDIVAWDYALSEHDWKLVQAVNNEADFSHSLARALLKAWGEEDVALSAWAIENAKVVIAGNGLIDGDKDNGILVEGIHSTAWEKFCDIGYDSEVGSAKLVIAGNGQPELPIAPVVDDTDDTEDLGIIGQDNGIWIARGVDLALISADVVPVSTDLVDDTDDTTEFSNFALLALSAWAIRDAEVKIVGNSLIRGEWNNGILVQGVQDNGIHDQPPPVLTALSSSDDFDGNLLIANNGTIIGGEHDELPLTKTDEHHGLDLGVNGIAITQGFDLAAFGFVPVSDEGPISMLGGDHDDHHDHDFFLGKLLSKLDGLFVVSGWGIDRAEVKISQNNLVKGLKDNGVLVEGVRGDGQAANGFHNLEISHNGTWDGLGIIGYDNGIAIKRVLYQTGTDCDPCDGPEGTVPGLSAWAVENASVEISGNTLIQGLTDDGILIEGVHAVRFSGDHSPTDPKSEVGIKSNWKIIGHDNGIAITRGFDLLALDGYIDWQDWKLIKSVLDEPDFSHDLLKAIDHSWGENDVGLSAWAIENATVEIRKNGLIQGETDNGILVEGIHSALWDKWCALIAQYQGGVIPLGVVDSSDRGTATLVIAKNGWTFPHDSDPVRTSTAGDEGSGYDPNKGIIGEDNGIWVARGVDLALINRYNPDYGGGAPGSGTYYDYSNWSQHLVLSAWAIQNAQVRILDNVLIKGKKDDGIRVEGVQRTVDDFGFQRDLRIALNDKIFGHDNGIHLGWGIDLELNAYQSVSNYDDYYDESTGSWHTSYGSFSSANVWISAWAIDSLTDPAASVTIRKNDKIIGEKDNGILVEGVYQDPLDDLHGRKNLHIDLNGVIKGGDNGIAITRGFDLQGFEYNGGEGASPLGHDERKLLGKVFDSEEDHGKLLATAGYLLGGWDYDVTSWAILYGSVKIGNNHLIKGEHKNGILVEGVRGTGIPQEGLINLRITDNGGEDWGGIIGKKNGISITRVLYDTWTDCNPCDGAEGSVPGISGWAVENASVLIAHNSLIHGKYDDGIHIEGVHATKHGDSLDGPEGRPAIALIDDDDTDVAPEASVIIDGNGAIVGGDNGIAITRGFDLVAYDWRVGRSDWKLIDAVEDNPDFTVPLIKALLKGWGENDVALSAWAIENATVEITDNRLIQGEDENGILVEGIHSASWDKFCDSCNLGEASLLISGNGIVETPPVGVAGVEDDDDFDGAGIIGGDNGIWISRGLELDFSPGQIFVATQAEPEGDDDDFEGLPSAHLEFQAWAILDATVKIVDNGPIEGLGANGILVDGVKRTADCFECQIELPDPELTAKAQGTQSDLEIARNTSITGATNGIHIAWGVESLDNGLNTFHADVPVFENGEPVPGAHDLTNDLVFDISAWAIQDAKVDIAENGLIYGKSENGILVEGVTDGGACSDGCEGPGGLSDGKDVNLIIQRNGTPDETDFSGIVGGRNGIHISWGADLSVQLLTHRFVTVIEDEVTIVQPGPYLGELSVAAHAWAIDSGVVVIGGNELILGQNENGIQVDGVFDGAECCNADKVNLAIDENPSIEGWTNGIKIGRGLDLDLSINGHFELPETTPVETALSLGDSHTNPFFPWEELGLTLEDFSIDGFAIGFAGDSTEGPNPVVATAIDGGHVQITGNASILGDTENGILVQGVRDQVRCDCLAEDQLWNLEISDNSTEGGTGIIWGAQNGIFLDRGYEFAISPVNQTEIGQDPVFLGTQIVASGWAIDNGTVSIDHNDRIWGEKGDGIRVLGVRGTPAGVPNGTDDNTDNTDNGLNFTSDGGVDFSTTAKPNLFIADNLDIEAGRTPFGDDPVDPTAGGDGIHIGKGFSFATFIPAEVDQPTLTDVLAIFGIGAPNIQTAGIEGGEEGGKHHHHFAPHLILENGISLPDFEIDLSQLEGEVEASVNGGTIVVDRNGHATRTVGGTDYDPENEHVVLGDYTFDGVVRGGDDGIDIDGDISTGSGVFIWRNMTVGSGDNGIEFDTIGATDPDFDLDAIAECEVDVSTSVTVLNNFILENGQALVDGDIENDAGVTGDGVHFGGFIDPGSIEQPLLVAIYQNFIARNAATGVHITEAAGIGASNIHVNQNFLPSLFSPDPDANGSFGLLNESVGTPNANDNWWGTADPALINVANVGFYANGLATVTTILTTGIDSNLELALGRTTLDNFAFQGGTSIPLPQTPPDVTPPTPGGGGTPAGSIFDPNFIRWVPPYLGVPPDTPGDAWYRWSAVNLEFPTDPLAGKYTLGGTGGSQGPESIEPAAGGEGQQGTDNCANQFLDDMNATCAEQP